MTRQTEGGAAPEARARKQIDRMLVEAGWVVQDYQLRNIAAGRGVAIREFELAAGHGRADYLLYVDGHPVGVLEAKREGVTLSGVESQAKKYSKGLPSELNPPIRPLPFLYLSTGTETMFANRLDPRPRSRRIFHFHRPETLAEWLQAEPLDNWTANWSADVGEGEGGGPAKKADGRPATLRARLQAMPPLVRGGLYPNQVTAVQNLEKSLAQDRPKSLIQMATGSGKTIMAVTAIYRLIKFGGARRVLFLVDRSNLGEQAEKEFVGFRTPDDNRKFTELYNVQRLAGHTVGDATKVVISTIQRLYSMLRGEEAPEEQDESCPFFDEGAVPAEPVTVAYNPAIPPEFCDVIVVDECHRSIYSLWKQVLEYFDAYLIGLTATPAKHTFGFFDGNLVMEYRHDQAVADRVNVDFEVYRIRTEITEQGSTIKASEHPVLGVRDRRTRTTRWQRPDEDLSYAGSDLDRNVVAMDQIRTVVRTFKDRLFTEILPGRKEVPKTLVFAKDDNHAEDVVTVMREEFGRGNDFCQKITYRTTGKKPADLIQEFRTGYEPRIAVTVDMIATGTDIKAIEIVMFMRAVRSRVLYEQMKGRGVRIINRDDLRAVTPDASAKTHFVIVDCVGMTETDLSDTQPLERKPTLSLKKLLNHVADGGTDPEILSSLASRLARLDKRCGPEDRELLSQTGGGVGPAELARSIVDALDPDEQEARARQDFQVGPEKTPTEEQVRRTAAAMAKEAVAPLVSSPELRNTLLELKKTYEQFLDVVSQDRLVTAAFEDATKARELILSFEAFIKENKDEIEALSFFYSQPYQGRLSFKDIKALAGVIKAPPRSWTPERLWQAYAMLDQDKVRGASGTRLLTDIVSLVRFALKREEELVPYGDRVRERFDNWLAQQENSGRAFTAQQVRWLEMMRDHIATSLEVDVEDFDYAPFAEEGGLGRASQVFGKELPEVLKELNEVLAA